MAALAEASLTERERQALDRLVPELRSEFRLRLPAVWLYGSRARGEEPHPESDIDLSSSLIALPPTTPEPSTL